MSVNKSPVPSLRAEIALWRDRKRRAIADYDKKIAGIQARIDGWNGAEEFLKRDTSQGSMLRPIRERNK